MTDKNQQVGYQWNTAWASYPYYNMYANVGFNAEGIQQYYQAYGSYPYNMINPQMYQNALVQQQQQYMRNFLPGGKLGTAASKNEEKRSDDSNEVKEDTASHCTQNTEILDELPPLPPGPPPKTPPPPEPASITPPKTIKFNIKNNVVTSPAQLNGVFAMTAKQKKRKRNKMNRMMKKLQMETVQLEDTGTVANKPPVHTPVKFTTRFLPKPTPLISNHVFKTINATPIIPNTIPPPPGCEDVKPVSPILNDQDTKIINSTPSIDHSTCNDYFAKINKAKSTLDMSEWPQSLMNYVNRCFSKCTTGKEKDQISEKLKIKIMQVTGNDLLWIKDWDNEPLPMLESEISLMPQTPICKTMPPKNIKNVKKKKVKRWHQQHLNDIAAESSNYDRKSYSDHAENWNKKQKRKSDQIESENYIPLKSNNDDNDEEKNSSQFKHKSKKTRKYHSLNNSVSEYSDGIIPVDKDIMDKRAARFSLGNKSVELDDNLKGSSVSKMSLVWNSTLNITEDRNPELDTDHIVGTCQDIEKQYLRLTSALEASSIRPPEILRQSLARVKERWLTNQDYHYACEQLKSIRQDLTVQGIRDKLTVDVYETHARIALEKGDHYEFNQCQSQLKLLYQETKCNSSDNSLEFTCYRILYYIFTKDATDLTKTIVELTPEERQHPCVSFALKISSACIVNNYKMFFKLYKESPRMASYLIDLFIHRIRKTAVATMIKAYRPNLPVSYVTQILGFENESQCTTLLKEIEVTFADEEMTKIDCKASSLKLPTTVRTVQ